LSENTKTCHGEAFFAEAISRSNSGNSSVAQNALRNDSSGYFFGQTLINFNPFKKSCPIIFLSEPENK